MVLKVAGAVLVVREVGDVGTVDVAGRVPVWEVVVVGAVALVVARAEMAVVLACVGVVPEGAAGAVEDAVLVDPDGTVLGNVVVL